MNGGTAGSASIVYFLGAGATRADHPTVPLGDDILDSILRGLPADDELPVLLSTVFASSSLDVNAGSKSRPRLDDVFTVMDAYLTGQAPLPRFWHPEHASRLRRRLVAEIGSVISRAMEEIPGANAKALATLALQQQAIILSSNYDIAMDTALRAIDNVNYGVAVRVEVHDFGPIPAAPFNMDKVRHLQPIPSLGINRGPVPLLKLHGSLNWLFCPRCSELDVTPEREGAAVLLNDPARGRCAVGWCTGRYEEVLVGPSVVQRYDHRILRETWALAERFLRDATHLVVIGYSLPDADYLIRAMLARTFSWRSRSVLFVEKQSDPPTGEDTALLARIQRLFPECAVRWDGLGGYLAELSESTSQP